jgi:thiamine biosynthesis protein ThiS
MIRVNDKWNLAWRPGMTVQDVLVALNFTHSVLVVSVNGALVPAADYPAHPLADQDQVKVIHVIAGG